MNENYWGVKNNTSLPELNAKSLVRNLKERYHKAYQNQGHQDEGNGGSGIYTWTGTVLLAVNPYQRLNVYGDTQIEHHFAKTITQADPHPFGIASHAFQTLNKSKSAQSIVVSGESGAGKTETAKFVMRFLSTIGRSGTGDSLAEFLESTNPILEAFGNAKTCRNENSSRFGKVMKLFYTQTGPANHKLGSAAVETYLLARSRVTHTPSNERNYHVFYLLTNGGVEAALPELKPLVRSASQFQYLASSASVGSGYLSDSDFLKEMLTAFSSLGVSREDQSKLFELVLALLWLGNIGLEAEDAKDANGKCRVSDSESSKEALEMVAKVLGVSANEVDGSTEPSLGKLLTEQKLSIGTSGRQNASSIWAGTNASKAKTVRDAVVRRVYAKLFDYIVSLLNSKLSSQMTNASTSSTAPTDENRFISILDIFGFENLPTNGLEQLCINYANERLQNFFLRNVVISEAEEYSRECIPYPGVSPPDNGPVIRAVAGRNGIFDLLKKITVDSMLRPLEGRDYDADFFAQLGPPGSSAVPSSSPLVRAAMTGGRGKNNPLTATFTVSHYAEDVPYLVEGFVDSNKDSDARVDFILGHFKNPLLQTCLATPVAGEDLSQRDQRRCIATTFSAQVDHLLDDHLEKTRLHCIRCVKPNDVKKAGLFEDDRVSNQLRVSGMFEVLTLMAHSYPVRIPYQDLFNRYKPLLNERILAELTRQSTTSRVLGASARLFVQETLGLLSHGDGGAGVISASVDLVEGSDFQFGTSKVFFRLGKVEPLERMLAQCDKDKAYAAQLADLIGKRILAKRKARQLCYMRTSFKLLVIYRRRQNYWKWFYLYFVRLTFLVKAGRQFFLPRLKAKRIQKRRAATCIQRAYRAHLERRKQAGVSLLQGLLSSYIARSKLSSQSKLRFEMTLSSEKIRGVLRRFAAQTRVGVLRDAAAEEAKAAALAALQLELEQERLEMERREEAARLELEAKRVENERLLRETAQRIEELETECSSRAAELETVKGDHVLKLEEAEQKLAQSEDEFRQRIAGLEEQLRGAMEDMERAKHQFASDMEVAVYSHSSEIERLKLAADEKEAALVAQVNELSIRIGQLEAELKLAGEEHGAAIDRLELARREDREESGKRVGELEEQLEKVRGELAERVDLYDYSRSQAEEEVAALKQAHECELAAAQQARAADHQELSEKITQLMDQLDTNLKLLERTKANDQEIIDRLMAQHEADLGSAREELARTKYELEARVEEMADKLRLRDEQFQGQSGELEDLKAAHASQLGVEREKVKEAEERLGARVVELMAEVANGESAVAEERRLLGIVKERHEEEMAAAREQLELLRAQAVETLAQVAAETEKHALAVAAMEAAHAEKQLAMEKEFEAKLAQMQTTQEMLSSEATTLLKEKELALEAAVAKYTEMELEMETQSESFTASVEKVKSDLGAELDRVREQLVLARQETERVERERDARIAELDVVVQGLKEELVANRASYDAAKTELAAETGRLESVLQASKAEAAAMTEKLESVVQEKAKLAVVASQSISQAEKMKKDTEDHLRRERAEMERKIQFETARIKRDFEIINKRTLEVKLYEVEELKQATQKRLEEAEKMRNDAVQMMQEILHKGALFDEDNNNQENNKTIAVLPVEKEDVVQQAIRDYHSASDDYERSYVIERRRDTVKKEKMIDSATINALEVKLQRTSVNAKVGDLTTQVVSPRGRKSLGNLANAMNAGGVKTPPSGKELSEQPAAKFPRLVANMTAGGRTSSN